MPINAFDAVILRCVDRRLDEPVRKYCKGRDFDYFRVAELTRPGGLLPLVHPELHVSAQHMLDNVEEFKIARWAVLYDIQSIVNLGAKEIIPVGHTDCKAYKATGLQIHGYADELKIQIQHLNDAAEEIREHFPTLQVTPLLADRMKNRSKFCIVEIQTASEKTS